MNFKAKLYYNPGYDEFDLYLKATVFGGQTLNFEIKTLEQSIERPFKPFISAGTLNFMAKDFVQAIMNAGWEEGLRPIGFADTKNETTAIKYHLEDMRKLVFKS